ncbi:hypothetical protein XENTR_v10017036 [Xenopus tropicalis]|nr:hypothetical protein XENTR_v10017036 [Xenopus tropicalis]
MTSGGGRYPESISEGPHQDLECSTLKDNRGTVCKTDHLNNKLLSSIFNHKETQEEGGILLKYIRCMYTFLYTS